MHAQKLLIDEQHRTIQLLESRLEESERKRNSQQSSWARNVEIEREKQRVRHSELLSEIEQLRKENKSKDLIVFDMEDQLSRQKQQLKEQSSQERKRINAEWEEKIKNIMFESSQKDKQNEQIKELVARQHKALQMQNDQFEEAAQKNEELEEVVSRLEEELSQALKLREDSEERLSEVVELMNRMEEELAGHRQGQNAKDQVE